MCFGPEKSVLQRKIRMLVTGRNWKRKCILQFTIEFSVGILQLSTDDHVQGHVVATGSECGLNTKTLRRSNQFFMSNMEGSF
jgi:hypothetical protein